MEDEEAGQIPMAYVVKAAGAELTEAQVIEYVARQVSLFDWLISQFSLV